MARTIAEIKKEMTDAFMNDEVLHEKYGFDKTKTFSEQFSRVSLESILFSIIAASIWVLETLFDKHQEEVSDTINKRAHTLAWYREKALAFQFGYDLRDDICEYDNSSLSDDEIEKSRIVSKASCEMSNAVFPTLLVKANTEEGAMTTEQRTAFASYMNEIADAGVDVTIISLNPDKIGLNMEILYDPLVMDAEGTLYNEGKQNIVEEYVADYLNNLEYNGALYPDLMEAYLIKRAGIKVARVKTLYVQKDGDTPKLVEDIMCAPESGAFTFDNSIVEGLKIEYKAFSNE